MRTWQVSYEDLGPGPSVSLQVFGTQESSSLSRELLSFNCFPISVILNLAFRAADCEVKDLYAGTFDNGDQQHTDPSLALLRAAVRHFARLRSG